MESNILKQKVSINCHSSICINDSIYIDPYNIKDELHNAEVIFLTHPHYDHCDLASIEKIANKNTIVVGTSDTLGLVAENFSIANMVEVDNNYVGNVSEIKFGTFPSYNIAKPFHPKDNGWVGYIIEVDGVSFVICGDCDAIAELKQLSADVLFVPIGGKYTMDGIEASQLTNIIAPKYVVPMHYGSVVGSVEDVDVFTNNINNNTQVVVLI